jgi:hypothetical protein
MPARGGKKNRKIGRTTRSPSHQKYVAKHQRFWNKVRRIVKHLKKFPNYKPFNLSPDVKAEVKKEMDKNV